MAQFTVYGILSYPHLIQARAISPGDDPKYTAMILVPKGDPQIAQLEQIIAQDKANGWPSGFPHNGKVFLKDSVTEFPNDPAIHGYMCVSTGAKQDQRPHLVDMNLQPITDPSQIYAGAMVHAAINTFTYNQTVNKGISAGLNGVMFTGEVGPLGRLDGRPSVESMFAGITGGAPAPQQPAAPSAPAPVTPPPAPAAVPPQPPAPPAAPAPSAVHQMTAAANGVTYEAYKANGWSDEQLIQNGLMLPPGGVAPSFA